MKVLFIYQFFHPETGAGPTRISEFAYNLVKAGHKVKVITSFPNYPHGIIFEGYRGKFFQREVLKGVIVERCLSYTSPKMSFIRRMMGEISFEIISTIRAMMSEQYDIVFVSSPPFFSGIVGYLISKIKNSCFIFDIRDLYPDSAIVYGVLRNPLAVKILRKLEYFYYQKADRIIAVTEGVRKHVLQCGINESKVIKIPNGANVDIFTPRSPSQEIIDKYKFGDKFIVIYVGRFARYHGTITIVECASLLKRNHDILFILIGEGTEKKNSMELAKKLELNNVIFLDEQPQNRVPLFLASADIGIAIAKDVEFVKMALHVKMFEYMACGIPVVLSALGESEEVIIESEAGICVPPENPQELAKAILELYHNPQLGKKMGMNGRRYVVEYYSREKLANRLERELLAAVRGNVRKKLF